MSKRKRREAVRMRWNRELSREDIYCCWGQVYFEVPRSWDGSNETALLFRVLKKRD